MDSSDKAIVMAVRDEVRHMRAAIDSISSDMQVTMSPEKFASLADLMERLADVVAFWPEETLDDPRYWVPLGHFKRIKAEAAHWQSEYGRVTSHQSFEELLRF